MRQRSGGTVASGARRRVLAGLVTVAASLGACTSELGEQLATDGAYEGAMVLETETHVLHSPYGPMLTGYLEGVVSDSLADLAALLDVRTDASLAVRCVPVPVDEELDVEAAAAQMEIVTVRRNALGGFATERDGERTAVIYLPAEESVALMAVTQASGTIRHELAHALVGLAGVELPDRWRVEGVATWLEHLPEDDRGLPYDARLMPLGLLPAAELWRDRPLDDVLAWPPLRDLPDDPEADAERYLASMALVAWIVRERGAPTARAAVEHVAGLDVATLPADEARFRAWLDGLDPAAEVAAGLADADPRRRAAAMERLNHHGPAAWLASVHGPETDRVVVDLLAEPMARHQAAMYLQFQRGTRLDAAAVERLARAEDPASRLVHHELLHRRAPDTDMTEVLAFWESLSVVERSELWFLRSRLDLPRPSFAEIQAARAAAADASAAERAHED